MLIVITLIETYDHVPLLHSLLFMILRSTVCVTSRPPKMLTEDYFAISSAPQGQIHEGLEISQATHTYKRTYIIFKHRIKRLITFKY